MSVPVTPQQLNRMLALRLILGAVVIGILSGTVAWLVESRRVEQSARKNISEAVRHFESPAMAALSGKASDLEHEAMNSLLARSNLVAIRVFPGIGDPVYENWGNLPDDTRNVLRDASRSKNMPERISVGGEELFRVALPLTGEEGPMGHIEGVFRIDTATLSVWRERVVASAMTAGASVLAAILLLYPLMLGLLRHATHLTSNLLDSNLSLLRALGNAVAKRDSETDAHNYRVTLYAVALAESVGLSRQVTAHLVVGAFLHDVGKIGIPDRILLKPAKLTDEEFKIMKTHSLLGLEIVAGNAWIEQAACVIRHHHERFDGTGYPDGLAGTDIPTISRVFAVADVFDALTSVRPYKNAVEPLEALAMMAQESGTHFDPALLEAFARTGARLHEEIGRASAESLRLKMRGILVHYFGTTGGNSTRGS